MVEYEMRRIPGDSAVDSVRVKLENTEDTPVLAKAELDLGERKIQSGMFQLVKGVDSEVIFTVGTQESVEGVTILEF